MRMKEFLFKKTHPKGEKKRGGSLYGKSIRRSRGQKLVGTPKVWSLPQSNQQNIAVPFHTLRLNTVWKGQQLESLNAVEPLHRAGVFFIIDWKKKHYHLSQSARSNLWARTQHCVAASHHGYDVAQQYNAMTQRKKVIVQQDSASEIFTTRCAAS